MNNYRKHIDDFFREKLGNYRETPPAEAWGELEERLDGLTPSAPGRNYRWVWHAAMISILAVLGVSAGKSIISSSFPEKETTATGQLANNIPAKQSITKPQTTADNNMAVTGNSILNGQGDKQKENGSGNPIVVAGGKQNKNNAVSRHANGRKSIAARLRNKKRWNIKDNNDNVVVSNTNKLNKFSVTSPDLTLSGKSTEEGNLPGTFKNANITDKQEEVVTQKKGELATKSPLKGEAKSAKASGFSKFEAGVKVGFEIGFSDGAVVKFALAPYVQYNLSSKFALMIQPAAKYASVRDRSLNDEQSFIHVNNDGHTDALHTPHSSVHGGALDTISWTNVYTYSQSHDSIVKSHKYGGSYMEYELPILLKYNISKKVSAYGGINLVYSKTITVRENTFTQKLTQNTLPDTIITRTLPNTVPDQSFTYTGNDISNYKNQYSTQQSEQLRIGYMVGLTYQCSQKWMIDGLIQQTPVNTQASGNNISTTQSATYFRLSIGYKLTK